MDSDETQYPGCPGCGCGWDGCSGGACAETRCPGGAHPDDLIGALPDDPDGGYPGDSGGAALGDPEDGDSDDPAYSEDPDDGDGDGDGGAYPDDGGASGGSWVGPLVWASDSAGTAGGHAALVGEVVHRPVGELDFDAALGGLEELAGLRSWIDAVEAHLIVRVRDLAAGQVSARGFLGVSGKLLADSLTAAEVGALLRVPDGTAKRLLDEALLLTEYNRPTLEALQEGRISRRHAVTVAQECAGIPLAAVPAFEEELIRVAEQTTVAKLGRRARRLREDHHPETLTVRKAKAVQDRGVSLEPAQDGMAWLSAFLPAEQAVGIYNRVDTAARALQCPQESRTLSQLRADVFADVLTHTCAGDPAQGTGHRGISAVVYVTVPVLTLLGRHKAGCPKNPNGATNTSGNNDGNRGSASGADGNGGAGKGSGDGGDLPGGLAVADLPGGALRICECGGIDGVTGLEACAPGLLEGYGPIDPDTARRLAAHAPSFTRILTHPETGAVVSVGRDAYRPPKHLKDWTRILNPTCTHPGCNVAASVSEIDHTVPWSQGGDTALWNTHPGCKRHHMFKTEGLWGGEQPEPGIFTATSLAGKNYTTLPEPPPPF